MFLASFSVATTVFSFHFFFSLLSHSVYICVCACVLHCTCFSFLAHVFMLIKMNIKHDVNLQAWHSRAASFKASMHANGFGGGGTTFYFILKHGCSLLSSFMPLKFSFLSFKMHFLWVLLVSIAPRPFQLQLLLFIYCSSSWKIWFKLYILP